jgi:hypothetical protein
VPARAVPHPRQPLAIGTDRHYRWLNGIVRALIVFNLLDAVFTLFWVRAGLALEANEVMRMLVNEHAVLFVVAKLALFSLSSLLLWRLRNHATAVVALFVAFVLYYLVLLHHLTFSSLLVRSYLTG